MSIPAYMTLEFANQGEASAGAMGEDSVGTLSKADREDQIQIIQFQHTIYAPTDTHSGQRVGPRIHQDMKILKMVDASSPLLLQALSSGDVVVNAEIEWYRINATGEEEHFFTTTIEDALITQILSYMPEIVTPAETGSNRDMSKLSAQANTFGYELVKKQTLGGSLAVDGNLSSQRESRPNLEEITFRYHTITWTHEIAGVEGTDSWAGGE